MKTIGVRQLKNETSRVIRKLREAGKPIGITYRGEVVAQLTPVRPAHVVLRREKAVWANLDQLAAEIGRHWPRKINAAKAVRQGRR
ncbi:MAG TPA: hypothetical protein VGK99_04460 [Acidobacteriota bacterium]|jgi:antitoxin (DNA-binding transcriptional repressor) of toxin-antitoxin stability system